MSDPLKPTATVLMKLGSIAVHVDEMFSATGHHFDKDVLDGLLKDAEVKAWLKQMNKLALIPRKR